MLIKFFVVLATFTLVTEAERLTCTKPGDKSDSGLETYDVSPGKKGATGSKGIKGEQYLSEEMMDNLEKKCNKPEHIVDSIKDPNQCNSNPCEFRRCEDGFRHYKCHCNPGFEGKNCSTAKLEVGWFTIDNRIQYKLLKTSGTWYESRTRCQSQNANLAHIGIRSLDMRRKLNLTRNVWIGLMDLNRNGAWTWVNGSNAAKKDIHWAPGEPNNRLKEFYGMIYGNHHQNVSKRLMTNNHYCWEEQQALCEKPI